ncbi:MAG TPA: aminotransferase class V-fold PLP-dependent enzyme [Candidatus Binataceae bacterium]|nr:aminotransferase class V-fold PLP-dependent enzyme [Candidatus Binataceae bacterium]
MATRTAVVKAYFNHGGLARPDQRVTRRVRSVDRKYAGLLFSEDGVRRLDATLDEARVAARSLIGAGERGGVSLLPNSSTALNLAITILGATLAPGALVVTTDQEHPCVTWPLGRLGARGVEVATIGGGSPTEFLENLRALIGRRRPDFAVFSHVSCKDGRILPVEDAGEILAPQEIPYIVDGAQALGQVAVDVTRIKAWAYAFTGHKWLFGPMGTGGLWTSDRFLRANTLAWTGPVGLIRKGGGELESGSLNCALFAGMAEALRACAGEFASRVETLTRLRGRIGGFLDRLYENTASRWNGPHAPGILAYALPSKVRSEELAEAALDRFGVAIKPLRPPQETNGFRVTFSPWTTDDEVELLGEAMRTLAPESH